MILKKTIFIFSKIALYLLFNIADLNLFANWEKIQNIPIPYSNGFYLEIFFLPSDPDYGWACGYKGYIIRTTDGGQTWRGSSLPFDLQLESIIFVNKLIGFTSGQGVIYKTTDGGASWFDITPDKLNYPALWGNYFIDEFNGMVIGGGCADQSQRFYKTTNGGLSWSLFTIFVPNTGMTDVILYSTNGLGYAVSSGRLWKTTNGGITWTIFSNSGYEAWQEELSHIGNTFLVPYSDDCTGGGPGGMRISTDMGLTWSQFSTGQPMFGTFLLDERHGWACGHDRNVYYTSNGGRTWELHNCGIEPGVKLDDLWFINDTTGWVVGEGVYRYYKPDTLKPEIQLKGPVFICDGDSVILTTTQEYRFYRWSTGETSKSITVKKNGKYWVFVGNTDCDTATTAAIDIYFYPEIVFEILADRNNSICEGDTITLSVSLPFVSYHWSTGETGPSIRVTKSGKYSVTVTDSNGCTKDKEFTIEFSPNPKPKINIENELPCVDDSTTLIATPGYAEYQWYEINSTTPASTGSNIFIVKETGIYYVKVITSKGCISFSDSVRIDFRLDTNKLNIDMLAYSEQMDYGEITHPELNCRNLTITNVSWQDVTIDKLKLLSNHTFSIPQSQLPMTIPAYSSIELTICFNANGIGLHLDTLLLPDICGTHILPLRAVVEPLIFNGATKCGVPIKLVSGGNRIEYMITTSDPRPNPASEIITLPFKIQTSNSFMPDINSYFYDSFGNLINVLITKNYIIRKEELKYIIEGEFSFKLININDGLHFIIFSTDNNVLSYPVIINH
jgi:hypothetical protein